MELALAALAAKPVAASVTRRRLLLESSTR